METFTNSPKTRDDADRIDFLQQFIMEFFTEDAILKGRLWDPNAPDKPRFEIPQSSVARYFQIQYQGGIERIFIATGGSTTSAMGNGRQLLHCPAGRFTYCYDTGTQASTLILCDVTFGYILIILAACAHGKDQCTLWA